MTATRERLQRSAEKIEQSPKEHINRVLDAIDAINQATQTLRRRGERKPAKSPETDGNEDPVLYEVRPLSGRLQAALIRLGGGPISEYHGSTNVTPSRPFFATGFRIEENIDLTGRDPDLPNNQRNRDKDEPVRITFIQHLSDEEAQKLDPRSEDYGYAWQRELKLTAKDRQKIEITTVDPKLKAVQHGLGKEAVAHAA